MINIWIIPFLGLLLFETIANYCAKQHQISSTLYWAILSQISYLIGNISWIYSLRMGIDLSVGGVLFAVITAIGTIVIGAYYGESITITKFIGFGFGIISVILLLK